MNRILIAILLLTGWSAAADRVDVYANSFREGGWKTDVQFMDVMGSPYLIAHGLGFPVPDAVATVQVPTSGKWRVWVRTRKWVDGAGRFRVLVNGAALAHVFGRGNSAWSWEDGGEVVLEPGAAEVCLRDEDGFDGRCAGLVLASAGERPEGAISVLDRKPEVSRSFDFVVVGGGLPGCCAALAAARRGLKVALVQDRPVPGGNASGEVRVWSAGEMRYPLVNELRGKFMNMRYENALSDSDRIAILEREPNLSTFLFHRAFGVEKDGNRVGAVKALDVAKNRVVEFRAPLFCDATGDGWIGFWAGAECRYGREGRDETGEKYAPEKGDRMTLGSSIMWQSADTTYDCPFTAPWAEPYACGLKRVNGDWNWEFGLKQDILATGEEVRDRVLLAIYGAFSNAKKLSENTQRKLVTCPFILGKRETRRIMGDHVFCEQDVMEKRMFDDAVATGSWSIDLHYTIDENIPFLTRCEQPHYGRYWIPYRSLYSKDVPNLFMAGRCFSCTHVGLGSPRVMNTLAQLGCAVGEAAAMCARGGYSPRELYAQGHARELQRNLGGDFPGNPDPARMSWRYVDDESDGVKFEGDWHQRFNCCGGQYGDKTSWSDEVGASVTYPLPVEKDGRYTLKGIVPHLFNQALPPVAELVIRSDGRMTRIKWNQLPESGFWRDLGTFDLRPGATLELRRSQGSPSPAVFADGFAVVPIIEAHVKSKVIVTPDRPTAVYEVGQKAKVRFEIVGTNEVALERGSVRVAVDNFGKRTLQPERVVDLREENPFELVLTKETPGFVRVSVSAVNTNELQIAGNAGQTEGVAVYGVAFSPDRIVSGTPNPDDFDDFWAEAIRKLDETVLVDAKVELVSEKSNAERDYYRVSFASAGGRRVYGWLSEPKDLSKGPFPVRINVPGAGIGAVGTCGDAKTISMTMNVHSYAQPEGEDASAAGERKRMYDAQDERFAKSNGVKRYCQAGIHLGRENYFYYASILGINRAVNWLAARPECDREDFTYSGTSQGGGFGLVLTAINPHIRRSCIFVPAIADLLGFKIEDRQSGWPQLIEAQLPENREAAEKWAPYFCGVNFARRIRVPIRFVVGFADTVCSPNAVYSAFNACQSKDKSILNGIQMGHGVYADFYKCLAAWEQRIIRAETNTDTSKPLRDVPDGSGYRDMARSKSSAQGCDGV